MSNIHLHRTTTATPEQYIAGLTDFGPDRSKIFSNSADEYLQVHHKDVSQADVTEGSAGVWERLHYDWSDPNRVVLTTTDSNVRGAGSWSHVHLWPPARPRVFPKCISLHNSVRPPESGRTNICS